METCLLFILISLLVLLLLHKNKKNLPPGPTNVPIISSFLWLLKPFSDLEPIIRNLQARYGPIITLQIASRPAIFISKSSLAHKALIQNGAVFADRPPPLPINRIMSSNQHTISSASYGPTWRLLRRNLTSEILHPSRVKSYSGARKWILHKLANRLLTESESKYPNRGIKVVDHFQYAVFYLLAIMCFGDELDDNQINQIKEVQQRLWLSSGQFNLLNFFPSLTKILLKNKWDEFLRMRKQQKDVILPLIRARKQTKKLDNIMLSYVDTLWDLELAEEKRKLTEGEIISLCSEFLNAGTGTTSTALQWIMANIVKYPTVTDGCHQA